MIEISGDRVRVTAPMLIANARGLLEQGRALMQAPALVVDLAAVAEADSSALTVVFGWLRSAQAQGRTLRLVNVPRSMTSLAELYGVSEFLPLA